MTKKFVLIDHSLKQDGGHMYEFARHILTAAKNAGYQPILAANAKLRTKVPWPASWQIFPIFRHHGYHQYRLSLGPDSPTCMDWNRTQFPADRYATDSPRSDSLSWWNRLQTRWHRWRQQIRLDDLRSGCCALIRKINLAPGDHVFFPTFTAFDLLGLVPCLAAMPESVHAHWHFEFHDGFHDRDPKDASWLRGQHLAVREHFRRLLKQIPEHHVHFYAVTDALVQAYEELAITPFRLLRYPVSPSIVQRARTPVSAQQTLRVFCANPIRDRDQAAFLTSMLKTFAVEHPAKPDWQLLIRTKKKEHVPRSPIVNTAVAKNESTVRPTTRIVRVPLALSPQAYESQISNANIGLFLYDRKIYEAKCSGILTEMLSAGIPVIVPAGCWLADQFVEQLYAHLDRLPSTAKVIHLESGCDVKWIGTRLDRTNTGIGSCFRISTRSASVSTSLVPPPDATDLLLRFHIDGISPSLASHVRWEANCVDATGRSLEVVIGTGGARQNRQHTYTLLPIPRETTQIHLVGHNAFSDASILVSDISLCYLAVDGVETAHCPAGAVGLVAADRSQVPRLLRNMIEHYAHFRHTAQQFAGPYAAIHDPAVIFRQLLANDLRINDCDGATDAA